VRRTCQDCGNTCEVHKGQHRNNWRCRTCARKRQHSISALHRAVRRSVRDGIVIKLSCEICGSEKSEAHHDDYAAPLDVRWLCRAHHRQHHVQHGPGLNAFSEETSA